MSMTGRVIHTPAPAAHSCVLPPTSEARDAKTHLPTVLEIGFDPENVYIWDCSGTVWECECGAVWVGEWVPTSTRGNWCEMGHARWRPERRKERKRRLGLNRRTCSYCDQLATGYSTGLRGKRFHCEVHG